MKTHFLKLPTNNKIMDTENLQTPDNEDSTENEFLESMQIHSMLSTDNKTESKSEPQPKTTKIKQPNEFHYLDEKKSNHILNTVQNLKHKTAILIMMDCGLRCTECVTLKMKNFDFKRKTITVKSLKKRGDEHTRIIPLSNRLLQVLAEYIKQRKPANEDEYLFKGIEENRHMSRKAMNRFCERFRAKNTNFKNLHPHTLRHTFATNLLNNGAELHHVKEMLGHKSYNTTLIYNHTPIKLLKKHIDNATDKKENKIIAFFKRIIGIKSKRNHFINFSTSANNFLIGREDELLTILDMLNKNINTILTGKIGVGKTHILKQIDLKDRKILQLDEMNNLKMTFVNMLLYLFDNDKEAIKNLLFPNFDKTQITQKLQKDSVYNLINEVIKITVKHEYILVIDNVDGITAKAVKCIELLKDHFTIITTARNIPLNKASFLWNFQQVEIKNLNRTESIELIHKLSYDLEIEDYELYRQHIYDQSGGNPRVIFELCERFRKEIVITDDTIRSVKHIGGIPEIDMSWSVMLLLACITLLRYTSREIGSESLRFIGGIALILLMFFRFFLSKSKRKFL